MVKRSLPRRPKRPRYMLYVSYELNAPTVAETTKEVEKVIGKDSCGSGAGFGMRDVEFEFNSAADRAQAIDKLRKHSTKYSVTTAEYTD